MLANIGLALTLDIYEIPEIAFLRIQKWSNDQDWEVYLYRSMNEYLDLHRYFYIGEFYATKNIIDGDYKNFKGDNKKK